MFLADYALAIDEEGDGEAEDSAVLFAGLGVAHYDRVIHFELLVEGGDGVRGVVHGDADDLEALRAVLVLQVDEVRDFGATGFAPGGPEIEENYLASVVREFEWRAGELGECEVGSRARLGLRVACIAARDYGCR